MAVSRRKADAIDYAAAANAAQRNHERICEGVHIFHCEGSTRPLPYPAVVAVGGRQKSEPHCGVEHDATRHARGQEMGHGDGGYGPLDSFVRRRDAGRELERSDACLY